uniref:CRISPR-associated endonuclease Cas2 n=1 Tax=Roseburia sp. TaxID=2049040 RepID=UPI003FEFCC4D
MNKFMRMLVFFDLPVVTAKERKAATKFRNFLLKDGYHMMQWSVYTRICNGTDAVAMHQQRLKLNLPEKGSVRLLTLTEKQFESIEVLLGTKTFDDGSQSTELLNIF